MRPQAHEIIRTWAFYTIAKALLHEDTVPWRHATISGWVLDPDRKKMSKSMGNVVLPTDLLERHTADAVRYWAASARLGADTAADEKVFKVGKRLQTKIFNASKFVLGQEADVGPVSAEIDRAFLASLRRLVERATAAWDDFNHAQALQDTNAFFWSQFTDNFIELSKMRARSEDDAAGRSSAVAALRLGLDVLLRLFAPFQPYITEEVWSWVFAQEKSTPSIHRAPWPDGSDFAAVPEPADPESFQVAADCWRAINKAKADAKVSTGHEVERLTIAASPKTLEKLRPGLPDVLLAARCHAHDLAEQTDLEDGSFAIRDATFIDR